MNKIRVLPDNLANQIAAGEVVERPASVIKELVENAIDAGARRIQIDVELGGRRLIRIADDGAGMTRDDAILAFERHATSKIRELEDLSQIATLGFRGEALASIASVAKVELITCDDATAATKVVIEGGRLVDVKDAARAQGTTLAVRDLFFNTPARRKFMRSEATENYHLTSIVTHYALANPEIAIVLTNNGREVLHVTPARDLRERAFQIFGGAMIESLIPVSGGRDFLAKVTGFVSAPRERRTTRDSQYFFVNNRYVRDKVIADGLREGFRSVLPHGVYPVAFLFLDVPIEEIDVNVHPAKTEVRFRRQEAIKDVIAEAVRESLARAGIVEPRPDDAAEVAGEVPSNTATMQEADIHSAGQEDELGQIPASPPPTPDVLPTAPMSNGHVDANPAETPSVPFSLFPVTEITDDSIASDFETIAEQRADDKPIRVQRPAMPEPAVSSPGHRVLPPVNSAVKVVSTPDVASISTATVRPIAQLHESFIIAVDDEGLLLIDQHVAHERILFDKFRSREVDRPIESQNLLLPETLDLSPAQSEAFGLVEDELASLGFSIMRLSGRTVAIKSVPNDLPASEARNLFAEILDAVEVSSRKGAKSALRDDIAASLACKAAIKINMKLTPEKMQWLIDRLVITSSPTTCPHGRPVLLRLTMKDIERGFHRS